MPSFGIHMLIFCSFKLLLTVSLIIIVKQLSLFSTDESSPGPDVQEETRKRRLEKFLVDNKLL